MKLRTVLVWIFILKTVIARDVEIDSFQALPDTDPEFVSFGTIRVTRKDRTTFVISGDMEYLRNFGNEYQIKTEISNSEGKTLIKNVLPACEFFKKDKMTWPQIVANSNVPKNAPCPFPKVLIEKHIQI